MSSAETNGIPLRIASSHFGSASFGTRSERTTATTVTPAATERSHAATGRHAVAFLTTRVRPRASASEDFRARGGGKTAKEDPPYPWRRGRGPRGRAGPDRTCERTRQAARETRAHGRGRPGSLRPRRRGGAAQGPRAPPAPSHEGPFE